MAEYRTGQGSGTRLGGILAALLVAGAVQAAAQVAVRPVNGQITGLVQEAEGGAPVGYALVEVAARGVRVFSSPSGLAPSPPIRHEFGVVQSPNCHEHSMFRHCRNESEGHLQQSCAHQAAACVVCDDQAFEREWIGEDLDESCPNRERPG